MDGWMERGGGRGRRGRQRGAQLEIASVSLLQSHNLGRWITFVASRASRFLFSVLPPSLFFLRTVPFIPTIFRIKRRRQRDLRVARRPLTYLTESQFELLYLINSAERPTQEAAVVSPPSIKQAAAPQQHNTAPGGGLR